MPQHNPNTRTIFPSRFITKISCITCVNWRVLNALAVSSHNYKWKQGIHFLYLCGLPFALGLIVNAFASPSSCVRMLYPTNHCLISRDMATIANGAVTNDYMWINRWTYCTWGRTVFRWHKHPWKQVAAHKALEISKEHKNMFDLSFVECILKISFDFSPLRTIRFKSPIEFEIICILIKMYGKYTLNGVFRFVLKVSKSMDVTLLSWYCTGYLLNMYLDLKCLGNKMKSNW